MLRQTAIRPICAGRHCQTAIRPGPFFVGLGAIRHPAKSCRYCRTHRTGAPTGKNRPQWIVPRTDRMIPALDWIRMRSSTGVLAQWIAVGFHTVQQYMQRLRPAQHHRLPQAAVCSPSHRHKSPGKTRFVVLGKKPFLLWYGQILVIRPQYKPTQEFCRTR